MFSIGPRWRLDHLSISIEAIDEVRHCGISEYQIKTPLLCKPYGQKNEDEDHEDQIHKHARIILQRFSSQRPKELPWELGGCSRQTRVPRSRLEVKASVPPAKINEISFHADSVVQKL